MYYGWFLDDEVKNHFLREAHDRKVEVFNKGLAIPDDYDSDGDDAYSVPEEDVVDEIDSMNEAVLEIFQELGLKFPTTMFINYVATAGRRADALTLYTNYDLQKSPSMEDIEKARVHFGFPCKASWFPKGVLFTWVDY